MTRSYEEAFHRTHDIQPFMSLGSRFAWVSPLDWADDDAVLNFAATIMERQQFASDREFNWLDEVSSAVIADVNEQLAEAEEAGELQDGLVWRSLLFLRLLASVAPMERSYGLGRRGPAFDWAFRGLHTGHDSSRRRNRGYAFLPLRQAGDPMIGAAAMRWLPRWCTTFFLLARDASISRPVTSLFANACWDVLWEMLSLDGADNERLTQEIFFALSSITSWAIDDEHDRRDEWVIELERAWNAGEVPRGAASVVATNFITRANSVTGCGVAEWASRVLEDFGDTLREHERLQYLVASIDTYERWRDERDAILAEIVDLNRRASEVEEIGSSSLFARDARLDVVKPLIRLLVLEQDLAGVMDLLRAWYGIPSAEPCDDNVLLVHPALFEGVAALWPGRAHIRFGTGEEGHKAVSAALDRALSISHDPDDDTDENREGIPAYSEGAGLEAAMCRYYRPIELAKQFQRIADPRSLVVFPSVSDPLQALFARELPLTLPLEVSLARARPMRPVRRVSVWAGFTQSTHFELDLLQAFGARYGWLVDVFPGSSDGDAADFRAFYERPEPDVLWVCGHGEFVAHRLTETGIVVTTPRAEREDGRHSDVVLPMEEIAGFAVPGSDRRLLVLNTCSGAATQGMAGMALIGLAQSLAKPSQMVIGHLWPASQAVALAFGGLFASHLDGRDTTTAFADTLRELRDPAGIVSAIESRSGKSFAGSFQVNKALSELSSIMAWGCPVLLT